MTRIAIVYGGIAGLVVIATILIGFALGSDHGSGGMLLGYAIMIVALTLIFLGVKRFRDRNNGGVIKFGPALLLGLMIAVVAGIIYAVGWEGYLAATDYSFMPTYIDATIEAKKAAGLAGAALDAESERGPRRVARSVHSYASTLDAEIAKLQAMAESYENPLYRMPMTFLEIFPVGLVIALISAAILRNPKAFPVRVAAK